MLRGKRSYLVCRDQEEVVERDASPSLLALLVLPSRWKPADDVDELDIWLAPTLPCLQRLDATLNARERERKMRNIKSNANLIVLGARWSLHSD